MPRARQMSARYRSSVASTESKLRNPDKDLLRAEIFALRGRSMSFCQIARAVGLHWTRVQQIVKASS